MDAGGLRDRADVRRAVKGGADIVGFGENEDFAGLGNAADVQGLDADEVNPAVLK